MNDLTTPQVSLHSNHPVTTSLNIACVFEKPHKDILAKINDLDCSVDFAGRNFSPCSYLDLNNRKRPQYELTRDGFVYLAFSFIGRKYAPFKEAYIEAFNAMEAELREIPSHVAALKRKLAKDALKGNPEWQKIKRYKAIKLTHLEIGKLIGHGASYVRREVREMEACGLLTPPANLHALQQGALHFHGEAHV